MIRAGTISEIHPASGHWLILDIGFAHRAASCGLMIDQASPEMLQFGGAVNAICDFIAASIKPINLVIEAPLSVAFDARGNPTGRAIERQGGMNRYWYTGPGPAVMVAAMYLIRTVVELDIHREIRLFEGFVSFKQRRKKSDHAQEVLLLREVIDAPKDFPDAIIAPEALKADSTDTLRSAFRVMGMDIGIPPVILRS